MPPRISPLKDTIHHVVTKSDKAKLEVKYINAVKGKVVSGMIYHFIITIICNHNQNLVTGYVN